MIDLIAVTQGTVALCAMFFYLGHVSQKYQVKFLLWSVAFIQMITLPAMYFVDEQSGNLLSILRVNMWVVILIGFGIGMFVLFNHAINTMDPAQSFEGNALGPEGENDHMQEDHFKKK